MLRTLITTICSSVTSIVSGLFKSWLVFVEQKRSTESAALNKAALEEECKNTEVLNKIKQLDKQELSEDDIDRALTKRSKRK